MLDLLCNALVCLKAWGVTDGFVLSFHGDPAPDVAVVAAVKQAYKELGDSLSQQIPTIPVTLGFARTSDGAVAVMERGYAFAEADVLRSKNLLFRQQILAYVPLVETIYRTLQQKGDRSLRDNILDEYDSDAEAERQCATAVD